VVNGRRRPVRGRRLAHAAPAPSYQLHPDPDRYQTIQKALADRGYFKGDPNGAWGDDSTDAMRRFQADRKIDNDGKIDALSLISLGLGPKHDGTTAAEPKLPPASDGVSSPPLIQPSTPDTPGGQPR
jgi:peptidoglycan hydrolase-like protein with peptidoglycan-binding domain